MHPSQHEIDDGLVHGATLRRWVQQGKAAGDSRPASLPLGAKGG